MSTLHPDDMTTLVAVAKSPSITNGQLAAIVGRKRETVLKNVRRLELMGYLTRNGKTADRVLRISRKGREILDFDPVAYVPDYYLQLLPVIDANPAVLNETLAGVIGRHKDTVTKVIGRMQADGYVVVTGVTKYRRLFLTEKGKSLLAEPE